MRLSSSRATASPTPATSRERLSWRDRASMPSSCFAQRRASAIRRALVMAVPACAATAMMRSTSRAEKRRGVVVSTARSPHTASASMTGATTPARMPRPAMRSRATVTWAGRSSSTTGIRSVTTCCRIADASIGIRTSGGTASDPAPTGVLSTRPSDPCSSRMKPAWSTAKISKRRWLTKAMISPASSRAERRTDRSASPASSLSRPPCSATRRSSWRVSPRPLASESACPRCSSRRDRLNRHVRPTLVAGRRPCCAWRYRVRTGMARYAAASSMPIQSSNASGPPGGFIPRGSVIACCYRLLQPMEPSRDRR